MEIYMKKVHLHLSGMIGTAFVLIFLSFKTQGAPSPQNGHDELKKCNFHFEMESSSESALNECRDKLGLKGKVPEMKAPADEIDKYYSDVKKNQFDDKVRLCRNLSKATCRLTILVQIRFSSSVS
jgi:hypothetical protein